MSALPYIALQLSTVQCSPSHSHSPSQDKVTKMIVTVHLINQIYKLWVSKQKSGYDPFDFVLLQLGSFSRPIDKV